MNCFRSGKSICAAWIIYGLVMVFFTGIPAYSQPQPESAISIDLNVPGTPASPMLYGLFVEEIGHAGDGGLYAELVRNQSFNESITPEAWKPVQPRGSSVQFFFDTTKPLNEKNPRSMRMDIVNTDGGRAGIANEGYWGISVKDGETYDFSVFARARDLDGPLLITLEDRNGTVYGQASIDIRGESWNKYTASLTANATDPVARLVISSEATGTVWIDTVSLFPRATWNNRPQGFRIDLVQKLKDLSPSFLRFPGGTFVQGNDRDSAFRWKNTIGPIEERPGHYNAHWVYWCSDGLGFHEYLQLAEDVGAIPMFVAYAGMSWIPTTSSRFGVMDPGRISAADVPLDDMGPIVQDVVDAIEYANGPVTSTWGALRAQNGHPEPFGLKYIEIGNEDGSNELYYERYMMIYNAVKEKYPDIEIIANGMRRSRPEDMPVEMVDDHAYIQPLAARRTAQRYDSYDRDGEKVFLGEYAVQQSAGPGNFRSALTEGILLNGVERNSDIVVMTAFAPLFSNVNSINWRPNLIYFNSEKSFGTPSYYLQKMYSANRLSTIAPVTVESGVIPLDVAGGIGLSMDNAQAEFKDITVTANGRTLYDFGGNPEGWEPFRGEWTTEGETGMQTGNGFDLRCVNETFDTGTTYTYTLKARKTGGEEGFRILFGVRDNGRTSLSLNLGMRRRGMLNAWNGGDSMDGPKHCIEHSYGGVIGRMVDGAIETGRWYDIRIEVDGRTATCYLDDAQLFSTNLPEDLGPSLDVAGGRADNGDIILKVVNAASMDQRVPLAMPGAPRITGTGTAWTLTAESYEDQNTFGQPMNVAPVERSLSGLSMPFTYTFPAQSVTVLRLQAR